MVHVFNTTAEQKKFLYSILFKVISTHTLSILVLNSVYMSIEITGNQHECVKAPIPLIHVCPILTLTRHRRSSDGSI